jgi:hypothetical protein
MASGPELQRFKAGTVPIVNLSQISKGDADCVLEILFGQVLYLVSLVLDCLVVFSLHFLFPI